MGLVLAALLHILPMCANAWDWRTLIRVRERPSFPAMLRLVWIRESVNGLLPVARIGGEIVSFRLLVRAAMRPATAAASLVVDMQLTLIAIWTAFARSRAGRDQFVLATSSSLAAFVALGKVLSPQFLIW